MAEGQTNQPKGFQIKVSEDRTQVVLGIDVDAEVSAAAVIAELREMKLASFDDGLVVEAIEKRKKEALTLTVATGKPATPERPGRMDYRVPVADGASCTVAKVESGQVVATRLPTVPGIEGRDVFGNTIVPGKPDQSLEIGRNLTTTKDEIIASARGNLRLYRNVLSVEPLLELRGDDGNAAPGSFDGDAVVKGSLNEGRKLQISGTLTVGGALEAVFLKTGGSVYVKGGIIGKHKGKLVIGGEVRCRFISGALIVASGDVNVQSEITHSHIACVGRLNVVRGPIIGGVSAAGGGVSCLTLGHPSGTRTIVEVGSGIASRSFSTSADEQIAANRAHVSEVRAKIAPLLKQMKHLTPQQREKATELMYEAEELEAATETMVANLEKQTRALSDKACAEVVVTEAVYPGVIVRFKGIETVISSALKGPLTLATRKSGLLTEVVLIDGIDQSKSALPSRPTDPIENAKLMQTLEAEAA